MASTRMLFRAQLKGGPALYRPDDWSFCFCTSDGVRANQYALRIAQSGRVKNGSASETGGS